jgi:transposase
LYSGFRSFAFVEDLAGLGVENVNAKVNRLVRAKLVSFARGENGIAFLLEHTLRRRHRQLKLMNALTRRGIPSESLGKKSKSRVLRSVSTPKEFLMDASRRLCFVYVPKHTSWLNQVEIWFSILARRVIRRAAVCVGECCGLVAREPARENSPLADDLTSIAPL